MKSFSPTTLVALLVAVCSFESLAQGNIVEVATAAGLTTVLDLVIAAGLAGALTNGASNLTVLAPNNAAFAALPKAILDTVTQKYNKDILAEILTYHVLGDRYPSGVVASLVGSNTPPTLQGATIAVSRQGANLFLNGNSQILAVDVPFLNGNKRSVVHVISAVLVPPAPFAFPKTITQIAIDLNTAGQFTFLFKALTSYGDTFTNLLSSYREKGLTVFAPTDDAFRQLPKRLRTFPLNPKCKKVMEKILRYHVVPNYLRSSQLRDGRLRTLAGKRLDVERKENNRIFVDGARVVDADIRASNGIIHAVDEVLIYYD